MIHFRFLLSLLLIASLFTSTAQAESDKTLSPYFLVKSAEEMAGSFPLQSTSAEVSITGVIADVKVTQVYKNEGHSPIEAVYVFPGSTRSAVYGMRMTIGDRIIWSKIQEKQKARKNYEAAKKEGKSASLLEQQRPNVFQMNVANIVPGETVKVELSYTELLIPTSGTYEFVYPTVVGPRYSNTQASDASGGGIWVQNPFLKQDVPPPYMFDLKVHLATGVPVHHIASSTHKVNVAFSKPSEATVTLSPDEISGGNRDFILNYRLQDEAIQTGALLFEGETENFFLLLAAPPQRVEAKDLPPREYIFIVDVSGSMHGYPLAITKELLRNLVHSLTPQDSFNVLLFASGSSLLSPTSLPATEENMQEALRFIDSQPGAGGTELLPALERALQLPKVENSSRNVVVVTDGYVEVEKEAFDVVRSNLGKANLFAFGIGTAVNRYLIDGLAHAGFGEPFVITNPLQAQHTANQFRKYIDSPVLTSIKVNYGDFDAYDVEPYAVPDLFADRPLAIFGKWRGKAKGTITFSGINGKELFEAKMDLSRVTPLPENQALRYLWARHKIATLSDYGHFGQREEFTKEITQLGLQYNLLTEFTSFLAVDEIISNPNGNQTTVKQPLPLPQGVSNLAVGNAIGTGPEPEVNLLIAITLLSLSFMAWRIHFRKA